MEDFVAIMMWVQGITIVLTIIRLALNRYPIAQKPKTYVDDVLVLVTGVYIFTWAWSLVHP